MAPKNILLEGDPLYREGIAGVAITPGELIIWDTTPDLNPHATAGGNAANKKVAIEDRDIGDDIDHDYIAGENVHYVIPRPGDVLYMWIKDGETTVIDGPLESDGAGALQVHTPQAVNEAGSATYTIYADAIVGYAEEVVSPSGARGRCRVRIA